MEDQRVLKHREPQAPTDQAARDTATSFETGDWTSQLQRTPQTAFTPQKTGHPLNGNSTANIEIQVENGPDPEEPTHRVRKGLPSWLTSFLLHCTLVTSLALVSINGSGKRMIDLVAASEDAIHLTNPAEVEFELQTPEITSEAMELEVLDEALTESEDLSEILDQTVMEASMDSDRELFESVASTGLTDSALPRRSAGGGGGANFFGVDGRGSDFVFIVDCSGSMADFGRWKQAKKELKESINGLDQDQRFLILLYNDGFVAMNDELRLVPSTDQERRKAIRWLNRNRPDSWTFCAEALQQALALEPDAVFLLSDGEFNDRNDVFIVLDEMNDKSRLRRLNRQQIPVHTVALGSHMGRFTMKQIADENGGVFKLVD